MRQNSILQQALNVSVESQQADAAIEELAANQVLEPVMPESQAIEEIAAVEEDIDTLGQVEQALGSDGVSLESLAHARGIVDAIGLRYGASSTYASMESAEDQRLNKDAILADLQQYRTGLESHITASMEGFFLAGNSLKNIGKNIDVMKKTITVLKSGDTEKIKEVKFGSLKLFLHVGGGFPQDVPRAIKEVGRGLELAMKHSDDVLTSAQKAAEIAIKTDWSDLAAADKARDQIKALNLNLDKISTDLNGFPMFGNRSFGVKIKGEAGELGDWNKKFSFGAGTPNAGLLRTALVVVGSIAALTVSLLGGLLVIAAASNSGGGKREIPIKDFAAALGEYAKSAEKIWAQRGNAIKKSTVHTKLMGDLKNVKGLPKDVRKAIARASSFGWSISNGVYNVVEHSVYALAAASVKAAYNVD